MKFYRLKTGRNLFSFGDRIGEVPVYEKPLAELQYSIIHALGFELIEVTNEKEILDSHYFIFEDDLVFTKNFVKKVLKASRTLPDQALRFCLNPNTFNTRYCLPQSLLEEENLKFSFYYRVKASAATQDFYIPQEIYENRISIPKQILQEGFYSFDQCDTFVIQILSPFHLLQANLAFLFLNYVGLRTLLPEFIIKRWLATNSKLFFRALSLRNKIGKNCKIHPTAILEGCELGDNVTIGAYSVVRVSKLGSGTSLEEHTLVKYSVLGKNNYVSNGNQINACMTYDEVFLIHGPYQFSIFGKAATAMAVINCDLRLDQKSIQIETSRGRLDSKQYLFGIAYGHGAKIGGGNIILPGRIVPNFLSLAPPSFTKTSFPRQEPLEATH